MADTVSDFLLGRLREWGVHRIFGYPGDGINAIMGAIQEAGGDPELIQARHEEMTVLEGDPGAAQLIRRTFKKKVRELIPG